MADFDNAIGRYAAIVEDGGNPVARIHLIVSTDQATAYLAARANQLTGGTVDILTTALKGVDK